MKLLKELTTITTLSKTLALLMFILMPIIGFFLGIKYQEMIDLANLQKQEILKPTPTPIPNQTLPEKITEYFYSSYIECLDHHFLYPNGKSPRLNCPFSKYKILSPEVLQKFESIRASDPILCAQNTPKKEIKIDKPIVKTDKSILIVVHTYYEMGGDWPIIVELKKVDEEWKIRNIICTQEIMSK